MLLVWCIVALISVRSAVCSEIRLDRALQSSSGNASKAIDNDLETASATKEATYSWLKVFFKTIYTITVEKVVIEKGHSFSPACVYKVTVYNDPIMGPVCGTYTHKSYG